MFDQLVPWNILPERKVYIGNTKQLDRATANLKDATQRIRAQREHIAELQELDERNRQQYEQLVNWTRELEVRNEAMLSGVREYMTEKDLYNDEERDRLTDLILKNKENVYTKKEKEHNVVLDRNSLF